MKILFIVTFFKLALGDLYAQTSFYDLSIVTVSGEVVNFSDYKGKKVLIIVASPGALKSKTAARYFGKLQSQYPDVSVLILPLDIGMDSSSVIENEVYPLLSNSKFSVLVKAGKDKTLETGTLLNWLTHGNNNKHFTKDIMSNEQYYVISESGELYAVLEKGVSDVFLKEVLTAPDVVFH